LPPTVGEESGMLDGMRIIIVAIGIVLALFGALWALQGFGVVGGSPMSNTTTWSVIGPITVLVGIAIAVFGWRRKSS
jgi:drug/metabolite transporter superfamily protein YnfA